MSAPVIQANYDALEQVASRFDEQNQAVQQMIQNIQGKMDPLQSHGWVGDSATAFYGEMQDQVLPTAVNLQNAFEEAANTVRQIIQAVQSAEEESANQFQIR